MIYLDNGATSLHKPETVYRAAERILRSGGNPGRGGYGAAMGASQTVYSCREEAARLFGCRPEQVVFTFNCTHGLNIAIRSLVKPDSRVVVSGFEHNAAVRPLYAMGIEPQVAGRRLFDWADTLEDFYQAVHRGADAAVFTHVSNVFGYILPIRQMASICRECSVPFILDAAQSAGTIDIDMEQLGAAFIAMPGHKGLLGPQGTGLLLCGGDVQPLLYGGTGSESARKDMPDDLPERLEAGTLNGPGIAGLLEGIRYVRRVGTQPIFDREHCAAMDCASRLRQLGLRVYTGEHQAATVSFVPWGDCEETAAFLAEHGIAVRAGLHCAPLAHESAGTFDTGTVRVSFGTDAAKSQTDALIRVLANLPKHLN